MTKGINYRFPGSPVELAGNTNALLGYWDKDLVCWFANDVYKEWFGISPEDMVGKTAMKDFPGSVFNKNLPYIKAVLEGKVQVFENEIKTLQGQIRNIMTTYCPDFENSTVIGFYLHTADITHLKTKTINIVKKKNEAAIQPQENILINVEKTLRSSLLTGFPGIAKLSRMHFISESKLIPRKNFSTTA